MFSIELCNLQTQKLRDSLKRKGYLDKTRRVVRDEDKKTVSIPVTTSFVELFIAPNRIEALRSSQELSNETEHISDLPSFSFDECRFRFTFSKEEVASVSSTPGIMKPRNALISSLKGLCEEHNVIWSDTMDKDVPQKWERHGDLVLLPNSCFQLHYWHVIGLALWETVARSLGVARVARKHVIAPDDFRSPQVQLLLGDNGWVRHIDNGIKYEYNIETNMFSAGNITEKLRVSSFNCKDETVVDLYAGIGYFTLPYLVHAGARYVHACEWNPHAVNALKHNLHLNGVEDRCSVHAGDNREVCPKNVADRVNLGLIPSSEQGWPVACAALKSQTGGILHIHANVTSSKSSSSVDTTSPPSPNEMTSARNYSNDTDEPIVSKILADDHNGSDQLPLSSHINDTEKEATDKPTSLNKPLKIKDTLNTCDTNDKSKLSETCENNDKKQSKKTRYLKFSKLNKPPKKEWIHYSREAAEKITKFLEEMHGNVWLCEVLHIEHVKSYAPHVDHVVVDLLCKPECLLPLNK